MQRIKAIMFVTVSTCLLIAVKTDYPFIAVLAVISVLLSLYNIYLIRKQDKDV